jgi:YjbE family integral membrane protein
MAFEAVLHAISMIFQIGLLDLVLSGDNAVVIALACRGLPTAQVKKAVMIGTSIAILLRVVLTTLAGWLLLVPLLKIAGAVLLMVIAIKLLIEEGEDPDSLSQSSPTTLAGAVSTVLIADLVMSMDNVVGLAAVAQGSVFYLLLGLLLSVPLLMFGSLQITRLLQRQPLLVSVCGALLGYVAGDIAVADPLVAGWVNTQSPALNLMLPLLCAAFVVLQARIIRQRRAVLPRPAPRLRKLTPAPEVAIPEIAASETPVPQFMVPSVAAEVAFDRAMTVAEVMAEQPEPTLVAVPEALKIPEPEILTAPASRPRRTLSAPLRILGGLVGIFGGSWLLFTVVGSLAGGLLPKPMADSAYVCPGSNATVYYRPGGSRVRIVTGTGEASGYVSLQKVLWENPAAAVRDLHLTPPTELEKTNSNVVTLSGGSFSQIQCVRAH